MATTRIIPLHAGKGRTVGKAISDIIDYVKNPEKTDHGRLITSYQCDSRVADAQFLLDKQTYAARTGRVRGADDVIAYHLRQSFVPGEITPEEANRLGVELARRFTKGKHAFVVCTHIDKSHTHNHIIWNSTTLECDRKFRNFWGSTRAVHRLSDTICIENGYSIVEAPKRRGQSYNKWLGDAAKPSHKELLRQAIDRALAQKPTSLEELLRLLEQDGFTVHRRGKTISISAEGWGNNVRFDRLGDGYTLDDLLAVLPGQKEHTPRKQPAPQAAPPKVNLLVDIQAKLQAGKGAGYARWAKVFNLKQMAQTLNYLSEHGLLDYADLETKTAEATARYNALSDQIKAAEKRMAEIAVLRTHIVNYAKTRDTYVAYRKAGYSRKFRQEHEEEILLHQAAKEAFKELNVKKLPTVKELQTEYAKLLADKKEAYAEYRQARAAMRELLTVKNGQLVDHGGIVFNHLFRGPLLTRDGGFDRGTVQQHFLFGHPLNTPVIVFIQHTTEAPGIPPSEEFSYAFRSPLWRGLDNLSRLPCRKSLKSSSEIHFQVALMVKAFIFQAVALLLIYVACRTMANVLL